MALRRCVEDGVFHGRWRRRWGPCCRMPGTRWGFVAFAGSAGEEDIVEIRVIDVELMGTDSYD